jgi:lon-related putative ATP-dependent protease
VPNPLSADELYRACEQDGFNFGTTDEVQAEEHILGQPKAAKALSFGLDMGGSGYHIFVAGQSGTGRESAVERLVGERSARRERPDDWVYVYNFKTPGRPKALRLPPGQAVIFKREIESLVQDLRLHLWAAGEAEEFKRALDENWADLRAARQAQFHELRAKAKGAGAVFRSGPDGISVTPEARGEHPAGGDQEALAAGRDALAAEWARGMEAVAQLESTAREARRELIEGQVGLYTASALERMRAHYRGYPEILAHCQDLYKDVIDQLEEQTSPWEREDSSRADLASMGYERYHVNVIADHSEDDGAPVVWVFNPTVPRLLGQVASDGSGRNGNGTPDFRLIRPGALHTANGGYLVLRTNDLYSEAEAWRALKRALVEREIRPDDSAASNSSKRGRLAPEAIPLAVTVILIGSARDYDRLYDRDEDFRSLFKVMVEFDERMARDSDGEAEYVAFMAGLCAQESLRPLDRSGVCQVIEHGARLAGSQAKLSARFGWLSDLVREADHWAAVAGRERITGEDVRRAAAEHRARHERAYSHQFEEILDEAVMIATDGDAVGQLNGLTIQSYGPYEYGLPSRITARTYMGKEGVVQIDREVELAGPIHNKGLLTLIGFLGGKYAEEMPLSLSAQMTFEQNYADIDGDSASAAELFALLSSLSGLPVKQGIAVTGSVNQVGEIQAIGSGTEKVEGWFDLCAKRGLTGDQGVIVPRASVKDLMLKAAVRDAVRAGDFHVWAAATVDEGLEILTGKAAAETHAAARERLSELAAGIESFGKQEEDEEAE